ncbi:hypothetical protein ANCCEY_02369 [Ancylostoma ceylanicum]|uniref:Uncharacterized protein n=1 Tax=Ancylostoma ceylanicum TaxID=53326 RepID=A0A0D6M4W4_9BILA|nr:hypothetical protein ANCCEY_02369 [Ancylostoma ceylanicum]
MSTTPYLQFRSFWMLRRTAHLFCSVGAKRYAHAQALSRVYDAVREACANIGAAPRVDPRGVFVNNELDLGSIGVYGFDYDYTLAVYTRELNELIYNLALRRLISQFKGLCTEAEDNCPMRK